MRNIILTLTIAFVVASTLTACLLKVRTSAEGGFVDLAPGSVLRLQRAVKIPQGRTRVFFHDGRPSIVASYDSPVCGLEVRTLDRGSDQIVKPGEFRVKRVENFWTEIASRDSEPVGIAQVRLVSYGGGSSSTPLIYQGYHLWLDSAEQPDVLRLTCIGLFSEMWEAKPPTLEEIEASLGSVATLELAAGG